MKNNIVSEFNNLPVPLSVLESDFFREFKVKPDDFDEKVIPSLVPNWDNSPRSGKNAIILHNSNPEFFEKHLEDVISTVKNKKNKLIFLKSWNEWAEGNYVEPDLKFGLGYINKLKKFLIN